MKHKSDTPQLTVIARAPFHIYYEGTARVVSANNKVGKFDVLPGHADFFSVMGAGEVLIETESDTINFAISGGIIGVRDDEVMLFVNM
jgi:F0F1-type ATP synthase epsilon subunit